MISLAAVPIPMPRMMAFPASIRDWLTRRLGHAFGTFPPARNLVPVASQPGKRIVLCLGDSITAGSYPRRLQARFTKARIELKVVNAGIPGYTSAEYLRYMSSRQLLARTNPKIVLLQLGTNDVRRRFLLRSTTTAQFQATMTTLITAILSHRNPDGKAPLLLLATIPPVTPTLFAFSRRSARRVTEEINPAIRRIAQETGLPLVDNFSFFTHHPEYLPGIHPNEQGYRALADNWYRAIREVGA